MGDRNMPLLTERWDHLGPLFL